MGGEGGKRSQIGIQTLTPFKTAKMKAYGRTDDGRSQGGVSGLTNHQW